VTDWWPTPRLLTARTPQVWWWTRRAGSSTGPTLGPTPSTGPTWTGGVQRWKSGRYLYISWNCRCRSRFLRFFVRFQLPLWNRALPFQPNPLQLGRPAALEKPSSNLKTVNRQFHSNFLWIFLSEQPQKPMGSDMIINDGRFFMRTPNSWAVLFFPLKKSSTKHHLSIGSPFLWCLKSQEISDDIPMSKNRQDVPMKISIHSHEIYHLLLIESSRFIPLKMFSWQSHYIIYIPWYLPLCPHKTLIKMMIQSPWNRLGLLSQATGSGWGMSIQKLGSHLELQSKVSQTHDLIEPDHHNHHNPLHSLSGESARIVSNSSAMSYD